MVRVFLFRKNTFFLTLRNRNGKYFIFSVLLRKNTTFLPFFQHFPHAIRQRIAENPPPLLQDLAEGFRETGQHLEGDLFWDFFVVGFGDAWKTKSVKS